MNQPQKDRIEDYLDGLLNDAETRRFEQDLLKEEVAAQLGEALALRELLGALPPDEPPPELVRRIESSLLGAASGGPVEETPPVKRWGRLAGAFKTAFGWPGYAVMGLAGGSGALKGSVGGLQTMGYALGPLKAPGQKGMRAIRRPLKPLWKTAFKKGMRRLSPW